MECAATAGATDLIRQARQLDRACEQELLLRFLTLVRGLPIIPLLGLDVHLPGGRGWCQRDSQAALLCPRLEHF